jgi:hypothetical protein
VRTTSLLRLGRRTRGQVDGSFATALRICPGFPALLRLLTIFANSLFHRLYKGDEGRTLFAHPAWPRGQTWAAKPSTFQISPL